jgi:hypothetical protein
MKTKLLFMLLTAFVVCVPAMDQKVVITGKKVTYTRKKPTEAFKKKFTIKYPKVKASTPALAKRIEAAISFRSILGLNLQEELTTNQWLEEADYKVIYNDKGVLCVDLFMEGSAAYPDGVTKTAVVDLRTGKLVKTSDVFSDLPGLAAMVKKAQKKEIADAIVELKSNPDFKDEDPADLFKEADYRRKDLEGFSVKGDGVTFKYDYGFPHVIQALQPTGEYFFSWEQLRPHLVPTGLFAKLAR